MASRRRGVNGSMDDPYESGQIQVQGLVVQHYHEAYSHASSTRSLGDWLSAENVVGVSGIDTRALTMRIREHGTCKGWIVPDQVDGEQAKNSADEVDMKQVFDDVAPSETKRYEAGELTVLVVDVGAKDNIVRSVAGAGRHGCPGQLEI